MVSHKKSVIRLMFLTLILITIFSSFQIRNVRAQSTFTYTFDESVLFEATNLIPDESFNVRNQTHFTEIYNGTFSFTNDDDYDNPAGWVIDDESGGSVNVFPELNSHNKVLELNDTNANILHITDSIDEQISGSFEFWYLITDSDPAYNYIDLHDGNLGYAAEIITKLGNFWYHDGAHQDTGITHIENTWYHIRIDFECGAGAYLGLSPDTWNLYINGIGFYDIDFHTPRDAIDRVIFQTSGANSYKAYYDAIGYSWDDDYNINDNIIPYNYPNNTLEADKNEFYNNEDGSITLPNQEVIPFWVELIASGIIVKDAPAFPTWVWADETAVLFQIINADHEGLERTFDVATSNIIQVNFTLYWYLRYENNKWYNVIEIDSFDDTLICRMRIDDDGLLGDLKLSYYNGASYVEIEDLGDEETELHLNITINNNIVKCDTDDGTYIFPTIVLNKEGLGDIKLETYAGGIDPEAWLYIDSIGVYIDGVSQSNDYANYYYDINGNYEHAEHNLIHLNATGFFSMFMRGAEIGSGSHTFFEYQNVSSISFFNTYKDHQVIRILDALLGISTNTTFTINSISITGVIMTDGVDNYFPIIDDGGIDNNKSYFYVDSYNRLRYTLYMNDNNSEYIEAIFNVPDLQTENYSASFLSNIDGNGNGYFRLSYTDDTSTFLKFPIWLTTTNIIIPQTREIATIGVLITDNDNFYNNICYGFVSNVQLIYIPDMSTQIITLNLMMVIVPIMVLLVPTFGISARYGKNTILPVFILMSIICFATNLIPLWVFFVIMLSSGAFLFMKRKAGDN